MAIGCTYVCCSEGQTKGYSSADHTESLEGRGIREVAESDLAGGWTETEGPVKDWGRIRRPVRLPRRRASDSQNPHVQEGFVY